MPFSSTGLSIGSRYLLPVKIFTRVQRPEHQGNTARSIGQGHVFRQHNRTNPINKRMAVFFCLPANVPAPAQTVITLDAQLRHNGLRPLIGQDGDFFFLCFWVAVTDGGILVFRMNGDGDVSRERQGVAVHIMMVAPAVLASLNRLPISSVSLKFTCMDGAWCLPDNRVRPR